MVKGSTGTSMGTIIYIKRSKKKKIKPVVSKQKNKTMLEVIENIKQHNIDKALKQAAKKDKKEEARRQELRQFRP